MFKHRRSQHELAAMITQAEAATVTTRPVVAFVEYSDYDYDFEISFAPYKVDFIQVRHQPCALCAASLRRQV